MTSCCPYKKQYIESHFSEFEIAMNSPQYATLYDNYIDLDSWIDYFLVTEVGKHIDAFKLSFFLYKRKDSNGGKIHFGPIWDFNLAYGNFDFSCEPGPWDWAFEFNEECSEWQPFWVKKFTQVPAISNQTHCRWIELRNGPFHTDSLMQFIDDQVAYIGEAQGRNFTRWPVLGEYVWPNDFVGDTYEEEVNFLKDWLVARLDWMDDNMIGSCIPSSTEDGSLNTDWKVYPTIVNDQLIIEQSILGSSASFQLYNILGENVGNTELNELQTILPFQDFPTGVYVFQIVVNNQIVQTGKLIKGKY